MKSMAYLLISSIFLLAAPAASADPNCRCRLYGEYYELGTTLCIRGNLRRCEMNLNNTSWKQIADFCPQAGLQPLPQSTPQTSISQTELAKLIPAKTSAAKTSAAMTSAE